VRILGGQTGLGSADADERARVIIRVQPAAAGASVALLDVDDLGRFSVQLVGEVAEAEQALRATGTGSLVNESEALIMVDSVRRMAGREADEAWQAGFAAMLGYARSKGWLTADGSQLRAHIEVSSGD
jgi:hypothetical protein